MAMKKRTSIALLEIIFCLGLLLTSSAFANVVINFEDLYKGEEGLIKIPEEYCGFKWYFENYAVTKNYIGFPPYYSFSNAVIGQAGLAVFNPEDYWSSHVIINHKIGGYFNFKSMSIASISPFLNGYLSVVGSNSTDHKIYQKIVEVNDKANIYNFNFPNIDTLLISKIGTAPIVVDNITYEPVYKPKIYGLFIGIGDRSPKIMDFYGDDIARDIYLKFTDAFKSVSLYYWGRADQEGGVTKDQIKSTLDTFTNVLKPGDSLFIYMTSHGGSSTKRGTETTKNPGDEFLIIGPNEALYDNDLFSYLSNDKLDNVNKLVILDSCGSKGFWGDNSFSDPGGDLEKLTKIRLIASAEEGDFAKYGIEGYGFFSMALLDGLTRNKKGYLDADSDENNNLTADEIENYIKNWSRLNHYLGQTVFDMDFGDPSIFTIDMWNPGGFKTDDYMDGLQVVPLPSSIIMLGSALIKLFLLKFRTK